MENNQKILFQNGIQEEGEIYAQMELITPERAVELLQKNAFNRPLKLKTVRHYMHQMQKKHWTTSGQTISISKEGHLIDGQHRLQAIINTGTTLPFLVAYNVDKESFKNYDNLTPRTAGDALTIQGVSSARTVSSGINFYKTLVEKTPAKVFYDNIGNSAKRGTGLKVIEKYYKLDTQEMLEFYHANVVVMEEFKRLAKQLYAKVKLFSEGQILGYCLYLYLQKGHDIETITSFFTQLFFNHNVTNKSIYNLRELLMVNITNNKQISPSIKAVYLIKCWNAYILDKVIKRYTYNENESLSDFI